MDKFKEILSQVSDDVLTEESKTAIIGAFDEAVDGRVAERVKLEVTSSYTVRWKTFYTTRKAFRVYWWWS